MTRLPPYISRLVVILVCLSPLACRGTDSRTRDSATATTTVSDSGQPQIGGRAITHDFAAILQSAQSSAYTYEASPRPPVAAKNPDDITHNGVAQGLAPTRFTIAKAMRSTTPTPLTEEVLAVIDSDRAYPELGILPALNYVWRYRADTDPTKWEVWLIPERAPRNAKQLTRSAERFTDGDHTEPRLVRAEKTRAAVVAIAFGACLEDPACQSGHCGYQ
jgi:hypothetical protein